MNTPLWDCMLDAELKKIALEAQRHPAKSLQRRQLLNLLIHKIQKSGKLCRPHQGHFVHFYPEIYTEACHRLCIYIGQKIDTFKADGEVLKWANFLLKKRFFWEASKEITSYYDIPGTDSPVSRLSTEELDIEFDRQMQNCDRLLPSQELVQFIQEDPDGKFSSAHIKHCPEANFQSIYIQRSEGYTWQDISQNLEIPHSTLSSFFQKCIKKFQPDFQQYFAD
ncbi:MAG: sigma-70 family RNA polymerase sigma factor [Cyanobacteriota bacterium]|nr:sigma-70 family RNA polymerase sigma factor [Cyanobacteriota bacterium]